MLYECTTDYDKSLPIFCNILQTVSHLLRVFHVNKYKITQEEEPQSGAVDYKWWTLFNKHHQVQKFSNICLGMNQQD